MAWAMKYFCFALILIVCFDVIMRYAFNAPTEWAFELAMMIGCTLYALAWTYTQRHKAHMRVDVIYAHLSPRGKAVVDILGTLFVFLPLAAVLISVSFSYMWRAWEINELSIETTWYPPIAPLRTVVVLGFLLLGLQTAAQFIRDLYLLIKKVPYD
jgi:TRAP-type mannitol/chloroaromatic compound transport system permease small subunit